MIQKTSIRPAGRALPVRCAQQTGKEASALDRLYVQVTSDFDQTGYMQPRAITWPDGRVFLIEDVRAFRPAGEGLPLDCYTVVIRGKERRLFFERTPSALGCRLGRWYVDLPG